MCVGMLLHEGCVFVLTRVYMSTCVHGRVVAMVTGMCVCLCQSTLQLFSAQRYLVSSSGGDGGEGGGGSVLV